jgi:hypothetical protein
MRNLWRATGIFLLVLAATAAAALPAGAAGKGKVGPEQYFTGVINGTDGNTINPITIEMGCFGPLHPGQTGHPLKGQTLAVHQMFPPGQASGSLGYTGNGSEIGVFFHAPPSARSRARAAAGTPVFTRYDKPRPLPTSVTLPCSGTGTVWFVPIPGVPPSTSASVPVQFVGQP